LAVLIHHYPEVKKWFFKIEDETKGRGLAVINIEAFSFVRKFKQGHFVDENIDEKDIIKAIAQELQEKIRKKLKVVDKHVYPSYDEYMAHFSTRGGIIEAECNGKVQQYSVSFLIEPNGDF